MRSARWNRATAAARSSFASRVRSRAGDPGNRSEQVERRITRRLRRVAATVAGRERGGLHAEEPDPALERHALQAFTGSAPYHLRVLRRRGNRLVARHRMEIVEAKLEADRPADVAGAAQVVGEVNAQLGEYLRE